MLSRAAGLKPVDQRHLPPSRGPQPRAQGPALSPGPRLGDLPLFWRPVTWNALNQADADTCDSVVFLGNVDWWYHNHGHSSVRIATRLARRLPTLWVNSIAMRMPVPGRTEIAGSRYARKLRSLLKGLRRDAATGMWIYSPWFIPRYTRGMAELNGRLVAGQIALVRRWLAMRRPSAWVSLPTFAPVVDRLKWHRVVFDRCDDFSALPEADGGLVQALESRLLQRADVTAYVHEPLYQRENGRARESRLLGHGVDFELFAGARPLGGPAPETPAEMADFSRPIVGFYGGLDEYRMDVALLLKVAAWLREDGRAGTLVLLGPKQMDLSALEAQPNFRWIGQKRPEELPRYAASFDVGMIPFVANAFNRAAAPVKLKEYLALGFPVAATRLPAYEPYEPLIHLADSHEEFLRALELALAERADPDRAARRRAAVAGDSWEKVAEAAAACLGARTC